MTRDLFQDLEFEYNSNNVVAIQDTSYQTVFFNFKNGKHDYDETTLLIDTQFLLFVSGTIEILSPIRLLGTIKIDLSDVNAPVILETSGLFRNFADQTQEATVSVLTDRTTTPPRDRSLYRFYKKNHRIAQ